jgi:hypothetical protein
MPTWPRPPGAVLDGVSGKLGDRTEILVRDGLIAEIGRSVDRPDGAEMIDLRAHGRPWAAAPRSSARRHSDASGRNMSLSSTDRTRAPSVPELFERQKHLWRSGLSGNPRRLTSRRPVRPVGSQPVSGERVP